MRSRHQSARLTIAAAVCAVMLLAAAAFAQSTDTRELQAYLHAVTQTSAAARTGGLREFVAQWPQSSLRKDAQEWLAWDTRVTDRNMAAGYAADVLKSDPANPMAIALTLDVQAPKSAAATAELAQRGIDGLKTMRAPAGMGAGEFYRVQTQVTAILCAAYGNAAFERKEYEAAREYLRRAVSISPDDARYAYALGLADLSGKNQNGPEGYLQLARAVNLAGGTEAARQINEYAADRYRKDGGKPGDWDRFIAAAAAPSTPGSQPTYSSAEPATVAKAAPAAAPPASAPAVAAAPAAVAKVPSPSVTTESTAPLPKPSDLPAAKVSEEFGGEAGLPGPDAAHRQPFRPGAPTSLGILIEASLTNNENRKTIENALGDLVRHLTANKNSEAFVLSFAKDVVFNEDLTGDYKLLEKAMDRIKPREGAALVDAVTMAAFQLNRVSREGNNRVLMVISDGQNLDSKSSGLNAMSQLDSGNVRVYCIGVGALGTDGGQRLQTLASRTGGDAAFIDDPSRFRGAAQQIAAKFGVDFPY